MMSEFFFKFVGENYVKGKGEPAMFEKLKEIIEEKLNAEGAAITEETSFKEDLDADSLDLFELVMALEDEYEIEIPTEDLEQIATVGDVINYINEHKE